MVNKIIEINQNLNKNDLEFIAHCDEVYAKSVQDVADLIKQNIDKTPIILLSGPSGSGKTTTALSVENLLDSTGFETHTLSLDNYFFPLDDLEKEIQPLRRLIGFMSVFSTPPLGCQGEVFL